MAFSPQETQFYDGLFKLIDKDDTGLLPGSNALPFLLSSSLPQQTLGEIWALSDASNNGFLTPVEWRNACRLIGYAQAGQKVDESLLNRSGGPLAKFQGHNPPAAPASGLPNINTGSGTSRFPPLTSQDRAKFTRVFVGCGPSNGLVTGDKARDVFVKSELGYAKLGQIWNLADTQQRGSLDLPDFIIGLYYIQSLKGDPSLELPATLPPGVYEQASGGRPMPPRLPASPASPLQAQRTGQLQPQTTGPRATPPRSFGTPTRQTSMLQQQQQPWDVTPDAKRISDGFFAGLDKENKGYIEGEVAVPFMLQSQLDEGTLATVWDLADIRKEGKLTKDEFAVAVHLINTKLAGKDLPEKLPTSLIPPSLRGAQETLASPTQPAGQSSAARDLFDLMGDDEPTPAPAQQSLSPTPTGQGFGSSFVAQPLSQNLTGQGFGSNFTQQPLSQTPTGQRGFASALSPNATGQGFASSFAPPPQQPLSRNVTGQQTPSQFIQPPSQSPVATTSGFGMANFMPVRSPPPGDLLGDDGDSSALNSAAEIGNKQNELANTTRSNAELESKRQALEKAKADSDAQLRELEVKLSEARSKHESETKLVADLSTRTNEQSATLKQLQKDVISAESELSALKSEKDEIGQALLRDKEEVRAMQKRMSEVAEETKTLKADLERLRKEARQQKGMVTIGKKQLATAEGTRDTVQHDIDNVHNEAIDEPAPPPTEAFTPFSPSLTQASAVPLPGTPDRALSPANTGKSNNPFDRFGFKPAAPASQARSPSIDGQEEQTSPGLAKAALLGAGGLLGAAAVGAGTLIASAADAITGHDEPKEAEKEKAPDADTEETVVNADPFGAPSTAAPTDRSLAATPADPFGAMGGPAAPAAPESAIDPEPAGSPEEDPFGMPSFSPPPPGPAASAFEANFDDSFDAPTPPTVTEGAPVVPPTEDMHLAPASEPTPVQATPADDADFDADFAEFDQARSETNVVQPAPVHSAAPQILSSLPADLRPEAPERSISTQALPPSSKPQTPVSEAFPETDSFASSPPRAAETMPEVQEVQEVTPVAAPRALEEESSDEEEGPEDLEAPKGYDKGKGKAVDQDFGTAPDDQPEQTDLAPPLPVEQTQGSVTVLDAPATKTRREAPPPPTSRGGSLPPAPIAPVSLPTHDDSAEASIAPQAEDNNLDPFGSSFASLPPGAAPAQVQPSSSVPAVGDFDNDDDFDFGDLPPAQVSNTAAAQDNKNAGDFDDEFSGFDDEFSKPGFEMVSPAQQSAPASHLSPRAPSSGFDSNMDEWGLGSTQAAPAQGAREPEAGTGNGFSFDDTFDSNFAAAPSSGAQPPTASTVEETFAPPPGPPPSHLAKPDLPPRQPSTAQPDDVEDVKKLCAMGFPRGLVIDALGANGYDFQKTLNVLLTD